MICSPHEAQRNAGSPPPHCAEFIIGRRFAPTRWLHAGYEPQLPLNQL